MWLMYLGVRDQARKDRKVSRHLLELSYYNKNCLIPWKNSLKFSEQKIKTQKKQRKWELDTAVGARGDIEKVLPFRG